MHLIVLIQKTPIDHILTFGAMTDLLEVLKIQLANKSKRVNKEINKRSFFLGDEYNKSDKCQKINQDKSEHALIALSGFLKEYNNSFGPIESHTCVLNSVLNLIQLLYLLPLP